MQKYLFVIIAIFSYSILGYAANPISNKKAELNRLSGQIEHLKTTITYDRQQKSDLELKLKTTEIGISKLSSQIRTFNQSIFQEQRELTKLQRFQQISVAKLNQQYHVFAQQLCAAFKLGETQSIKIILNQQNPNTIQRHMNYYRYLNQARIELIKKIEESLAVIKLNMQDITLHQQNVKKLLTHKQQQQNELRHAQFERLHLIKRFHQRVQNKEQELTLLISNQKALQDIISHLQVQTESNITGKPFTQPQGKLHWPVKGLITARFGSPLDVGDQHLQGVIIRANQGAPVQAVAAGQVIFANWLRGFGLLIIVKHSANYMSLYARNHALYVKTGDRINSGDIIASIGNSGGFDKTGLYFEVRQNGIPINPNLWCS